MKKQVILLFTVFLSINLFAQTKQDIFCNPDIVWAGTIDLDFIVDVDSNHVPDWSAYKLSGLGGWYKQLTWDKNPQKKLNELILENVETIQFYEYDSLKYEKHYQSLNLTDVTVEPETYGDRGKPYPARAFHIFRLKCLFYYEKSTLDFKLIPQAVAVLRPLYDVPSEVLFYDTLGWLPVDFLAKALNVSSSELVEYRFQRDVSFEHTRVFKQAWTHTEVMESFIPKIRQKALTGDIDLYDRYWGDLEKIDTETLQQLGRDELMDMGFDDFDKTPQYVEWPGEQYKGIRFSMKWFWNPKEQSISIQTTDFSPLTIKTDDSGEELGLYPLFLKN